MTIIYGQIESLKRIRETLSQKGIFRFNSIGDINKFLKNYDHDKEKLFFQIERDFDLELDSLQVEGLNLQKNYDTLKTNAVIRLKDLLSSLNKRFETLTLRFYKNPFKELADWYLLQILKGTKFILEKSFNLIIRLQIFRTRKHLKLSLKKINAYTAKRQAIISARCIQKFKELEYTKNVVTELNPLIAGAIGEDLVEKELKKLSDTYVLFNDFSLKFEKPIYNKNENDYIFSIQIDHLLVTNAGIFIIETKNWSKKSIERFDIRSPVKQIKRASFALFFILNIKKSEPSSFLKPHHWGDRHLPIKNIVVMINHRPKEQFNFVAIKKLVELNGYINCFQPIFDEFEVRSIAEHLKRIKNEK